MQSTLCGRDVVELYFLEMRARALEIAASLDRIERADGGPQVMTGDPRLATLREAFAVLGRTGCTDRAEQVLQLFSLEG
jgi:hypothetical protein